MVQKWKKSRHIFLRKELHLLGMGFKPSIPIWGMGSEFSGWWIPSIPNDLKRKWMLKTGEKTGFRFSMFKKPFFSRWFKSRPLGIPSWRPQKTFEIPSLKTPQRIQKDHFEGWLVWKISALIPKNPASYRFIHPLHWKIQGVLGRENNKPSFPMIFRTWNAFADSSIATPRHSEWSPKRRYLGHIYGNQGRPNAREMGPPKW